MSIEAAKQRLRREMGALRRRVEPTVRAQAADAVMRHVLAWPGLWPRRRVALYVALPDEVPTQALMRALVDRGHPLVLPRAADRERLEFAPVADLSALVAGRFGALEPPVGPVAVALAADDLVLVPGVAFDLRGRRLGRGGGWYDRSLPGDVEDVFGIAFEFQLVGLVPATATDRSVRGVFTERGLHHCAVAREAGPDSS